VIRAGGDIEKEQSTDTEVLPGPAGSKISASFAASQAGATTGTLCQLNSVAWVRIADGIAAFVPSAGVAEIDVLEVAEATGTRTICALVGVAVDPRTNATTVRRATRNREHVG